MCRHVLFLGVALLATSATAQPFTPVTFELESGETIAAEQGEVSVPENRSDPDSRLISIRFVRFRSRAARPASPIFYLAGGPGGSGTAAARGARWVLFDRLRDVADVIALDQRGTGLSGEVPRCESSVVVSPDSATTRERYVRLHRRALTECLEFWKSEGVNVRGYTTWESAADIEAVRQALGADRVSLLGISYGTHLALATLKRFPDRVDRLVLASPEGLDDTVKRPALTDAYFKRLQAALDADSASAALYPDVRGLIQGVLDHVEADSPRVTVRRRDGSTFERTLGRFEVQLASGYMIADPDRAASLLRAYADAAEGRFDFFGYFASPAITLDAMSLAMDLASGVSPERLALVETEAGRALLGDALNFPMPHLCDSVPGLDLGDAFRTPVRSDRPALVLSGTLDGRTYPEAHAEVAAGFSSGAVVTVENAGHNLFLSHPGLLPLIADFFAGAPAMSRTLVAPQPRFAE